MKSQKGGRVAMPIEYYHANVKGPFTQNGSAATLARGMVDSSGCTMGPLLVGGKRTKRRRHKSKPANNLPMNNVKKPRKRSRRRSRK